MFKLQVVLIPPSLQNAASTFGFASSTADSSQLLGTTPLMGPGAQRNGDTTLPYQPSLSAANTSIFPSHIAQVKRRKFLHFTKSANSLLELSFEIIEKCGKMYPSLDEEVEILSLQDSSGCDLDPDFLVKDVFNMDNTVRVILKSELNIDDSTPVSLYRSDKRDAKRQKLNNQQPRSQVQVPGSVGSVNNGGILKIAKKRSSASGIRLPTNPNMRISTPLAHQIYPPPPHNNLRAVSNNSEDEDEDAAEDADERSFLPPPAQPQSPPIRISSGFGNTKKIRSGTEDDTVSRSETVDPDKSKQQRLLSGTPIRPAMTPNRVTLTGQRVVSDRLNNINRSIFSAGSIPTNRQTSSTNARITSGMLSIPEPKIAEIERELREGPSSPASLLPAVPKRIPMKKPYQGATTNLSDDEYSGSDDQHTDSQAKTSIQRQTSIADNNGSPVKDTSNGEGGLQHFHLPDLPKNTKPLSNKQRESSLEMKVQKKHSTVIPTRAEDDLIRKESFSEDEDIEKEQEQKDHEMESEIGIINSKKNNQMAVEKKGLQHFEEDAEDAGSEEEEEEEEEEEKEEEDVDGDDTVLINRNSLGSKSPSNTSIQKDDFVKYMEGDKTKMPSWYPNNTQLYDGRAKPKPYTTVLYNDIDNSKPDPRNIMPKRLPRDAAKKAAELLSGRQVSKSDSEDNSASLFEDSSSGIETDDAFDDDTVDERVSITENNNVRTLKIHPLKEKVISGPDLPSKIDGTSNSHTNTEASSTESEYSEQETDQEAVKNTERKSELRSLITKPANGVATGSKDSNKTIPNDCIPDGTKDPNNNSIERTALKLNSKEEITASNGTQKEKGRNQMTDKEANYKMEQEAKLKAEKEAKLKAEKEAMLIAEKEAKLKAEKEAMLIAEKEAMLIAEKEAMLIAEKEAMLKAEKEAKLKAEKEAKLKAEKEAKLKAEKEAKLKAEKEAKLKAEKEAKLKAEKEAKLKAEKATKSKVITDAKQRVSSGTKQNETKKREEKSSNNVVSNETKDKVKEEHSLNSKNLSANRNRSKGSSNINGNPNQTKPPEGDKDVDVGTVGHTLSPKPEDNQKLQELKAKFTKARTYVPAGLVSQKISRSDSESSEETNSSDDESSSEYSSSSSNEEDSSSSKKIKRLIVDTPKGSLNTKGRVPFNKSETGVEDAPQSTQNDKSSHQATPNKVPITRLIDVSSPLSTNSEKQKNRSLLQGLPPKVRPSLSSLSDLASRGVPEVREKDVHSSQTNNNYKKSEDRVSGDDNESESESQSESESESESDSDSIDSGSDSSSSSEENSFISAKSASTALGKKKKNSGGFASLIKDFKRG